MTDAVLACCCAASHEREGEVVPAGIKPQTSGARPIHREAEPPGGTFLMGDPFGEGYAADGEKLVHEVSLGAGIMPISGKAPFRPATPPPTAGWRPLRWKATHRTVSVSSRWLARSGNGTRSGSSGIPTRHPAIRKARQTESGGSSAAAPISATSLTGTITGWRRAVPVRQAPRAAILAFEPFPADLHSA